MDIITKNDIQNLENAPINLMTKDNAQKQLNVLDNEKKEKYKKLWKTISRKALDLSLKDPWGEFKIENEKTQKCIRYMYNAVHKVWKKDEVYVKKQDKVCKLFNVKIFIFMMFNFKSFARGGMRECFRVKKMDKLSNHTNWKLAMNYVCKRYIQDVDRNVLFEDVKLQMDSKLWAEEFNRHNPPKKVCLIFVMYNFKKILD